MSDVYLHNPLVVANKPTAGKGVALDPLGRVPRRVINLGAVTAAATGDLTLSTSATDVAGATVTVPEPGVYFVTATFDFVGSVTGWTNAVGTVTGLTAQALMGDDGSANCTATVSQSGLVTVTDASLVLKLQAAKTVNAGTIKAGMTHTTLTAVRVR